MTAGDDNSCRRPLPEELTVEILVRLPVASLLRFKCVCKEWYKIINTPAFISRWSRPPKILVYDHSGCQPEDRSESPTNPKPVTLISTSDGAHECPDYMYEFRGLTYLLGSVDGLFLLERVVERVYNIQLALCNPATREVRHLPDPNFDLPPSLSENICPQYGFGLDPKTNDYKVVWFRFLRDRNTGRMVEPIYGAVYSCSRDSWRAVHPEIHETFEKWGFRGALCTTYLNGVYYWLMISRSIFKSRCYLVSFDFGDEVFEEITGPDVDEHNRVGQRLILFDGSIAFLNPVGFEFNYDIWVMTKPGVWNKLVNFQCFGSCGSIRSWKNTTVILISQDYYLVSYDVGTQETRYLGSSQYPGVRLMKRFGGSSVHFYKESLVPIKRDHCSLGRCSWVRPDGKTPE